MLRRVQSLRYVDGRTEPPSPFRAAAADFPRVAPERLLWLEIITPFATRHGCRHESAAYACCDELLF